MHVVVYSMQNFRWLQPPSLSTFFFCISYILVCHLDRCMCFLQWTDGFERSVFFPLLEMVFCFLSVFLYYISYMIGRIRPEEFWLRVVYFLCCMDVPLGSVSFLFLSICPWLIYLCYLRLLCREIDAMGLHNTEHHIYDTHKVRLVSVQNTFHILFGGHALVFPSLHNEFHNLFC